MIVATARATATSLLNWGRLTPRIRNPTVVESRTVGQPSVLNPSVSYLNPEDSLRPGGNARSRAEFLQVRSLLVVAFASKPATGRWTTHSRSTPGARIKHYIVGELYSDRRVTEIYEG